MAEQASGDGSLLAGVPRPTRQRVAVLGADGCARRCDRTGDPRAARRSGGRVGLATVYRTLGRLAEPASSTRSPTSAASRATGGAAPTTIITSSAPAATGSSSSATAGSTLARRSRRGTRLRAGSARGRGHRSLPELSGLERLALPQGVYGARDSLAAHGHGSPPRPETRYAASPEGGYFAYQVFGRPSRPGLHDQLGHEHGRDVG